MKVEVGQIWYHYQDLNRQYRITSIEKTLGGYVAKADLIDQNENVVQSRVNLVNLNSNMIANWSPGWQRKYPPNSYSRVSQKFLRKRMRDQMAAEVFTHRLTEQTLKLPEPSSILETWSSIRVQGRSVEQTLQDMRYFQERLIQSLNLPSNWSHDP